MKTYTEENLRKLTELIDDAYRPFTRDNFQGNNIVEDFISGKYDVKPVEEETISFSYSFLRRKLDWLEICELTGLSEYCRREGYEIKDTDTFIVTESKAKEFNLI